MTVRTRQGQGDTLERLDHPDRRGPLLPACQVQSFRPAPDGHDGGHSARMVMTVQGMTGVNPRAPDPFSVTAGKAWPHPFCVVAQKAWSLAGPTPEAMEQRPSEQGHGGHLPAAPPYPWPTQPAGASPSVDLAVSTNSRRSGCAARPSSGSRRTGLASVAEGREVGSRSNRAIHLPAEVHGSGRRPPGADTRHPRCLEKRRKRSSQERRTTRTTRTTRITALQSCCG
jgi:hypothetical protein